MDYEKKYKEALKEAEKIHKFSSNIAEIKRMEQIFPELKESYGERIRKALIKAVSRTKGNKLFGTDVTREEALAWLEKQDPQILANSCKTRKEEQKPFDYENANIHQKDYAPKEEPTFKVGDWITNGDYTWKIVEVEPLDYILQSQNGNTVDDTISHVNEQFHSFTIEDAKDGDVLCLYYNNRKTFFIFKAIIGEGDYADILVHCCYTGKYQYLEPSFNGECRMHQISDGGYCLPADKEEQDILFQKMKEAGYTFDFEKKELKKIEQKSQRMVSAEAKEALYDKPAWSEEDEKEYKYVLKLVDNILNNCGNKKDYERYKRCYDWLKSFKERIEKQ